MHDLLPLLIYKLIIFHPLKMKNIIYIGITIITLLLSSIIEAAVVITEDFSTTTFTTTSAGVISFGGAAPPAPNVLAGEWFGSTNGVNINGGTLNFTHVNRNRTRGAGIWVDSQSLGNGIVTITFDVLNFTAGTNAQSIFQAYSLNDSANNTVGFDLHGNRNLVISTASTIGSSATIDANTTTVSISFDVTDQQSIALIFTNIAQNGTSTQNEFSIDNLEVSFAVPEPSSLILIILSSFILTLRRRK